MLIRTTLRLNKQLKYTAEKRAIEMNTTLQDIFNEALKQYLEQDAKKMAKKIVFKSHDLGEPLDNLKRADYYQEL